MEMNDNSSDTATKQTLMVRPDFLRHFFGTENTAVHTQ